ncbi:thioredoxin [Candidatus Woesearchaeota archaeon]|nr:thioredoxin [Candidatus Woesearchaeota archaeon]
MELNQDNFEEKVVKSKKMVVVDYFAPWCQPCKMIAPVFEKLSKQLTHIMFAKVNVDENSQLASDQGVMNIPCVIIYNNGEEVDRIVGFQTEQQLKSKIINSLS